MLFRHSKADFLVLNIVYYKSTPGRSTLSGYYPYPFYGFRRQTQHIMKPKVLFYQLCSKIEHFTYSKNHEIFKPWSWIVLELSAARFENNIHIHDMAHLLYLYFKAAPALKICLTLTISFGANKTSNWFPIRCVEWVCGVRGGAHCIIILMRISRMTRWSAKILNYSNREKAKVGFSYSPQYCSVYVIVFLTNKQKRWWRDTTHSWPIMACISDITTKHNNRKLWTIHFIQKRY